MINQLLKEFGKMLRPMRVQLANMVSRAIVQQVDDTQKMQLLQIEALAGETRDEIERFQNYGFTSVPKANAESVVLWVGGRRDHGLAIAVDDRGYRIRNQQPGEVTVYDSTGSTITLKANGDIQIVPSSGNVTVTGTLTASVDVVGGGKSLKNHTHSAGTYTAGATPVTLTSGTPT